MPRATVDHPCISPTAVNLMKSLFGCLIAFVTLANVAFSQESKPIRALLIAGGCCHDYSAQQQAIADGIEARANVRVDVYWTSDSSTNPPLPIYSNPDWAAGYDVIIHDECAVDIADPAIISRIVETHQTIPAVHLHCAMHSFRNGTDVWFKHLGLQSNGHGPQEPIDIQFVDTEHPITATLKDWRTINEELYNNIAVLDAHPIATGTQIVDGNREDKAVVVWTNEKQGARSFSTTIGHNNATVQDPRYLELVTRGLLWACDKLEPSYLTPYTGNRTVTQVETDVPNL